MTDETGVAGAQNIYWAFGEQFRRLGTGDATDTCEGKELQGETRLYYFNSQYYVLRVPLYRHRCRIGESDFEVQYIISDWGFEEGLAAAEPEPLASIYRSKTGDPFPAITGKFKSALTISRPA